MADELIEHLSEWLMGTHLDADASVPDLVQAIVGRAGSKAAAARAVGVPRSTLYGWLRGSAPKMAKQAMIAAARLAFTDSGKWKPAHRGDTSLVIKGTVRVSKDTRVRTLRVGDHIPKRKIQTFLNHWKRGADDKSFTTLFNAIQKHYAAGMDIDNVIGVWFE